MTQVSEGRRISADSICIRPYINAKNENMGLENYGLVLHEGTTHKEYLTCIELHGAKRYLNGLDEFAPSVQRIPNEKEKKAVIKSIREKVIYLEKALAGNDTLKVEDEDFWKKVTLLKRDNHDFWGQIFLETGNDLHYLDEKDPNDLILLSCIEAGGFSEVAPAYEDARSSSYNYRWYLDKKKETSAAKASAKKIKNAAISILDALFNGKPKTLWYVAKCIDSNAAQYKNTTPMDAVYDNMDSYINGQGPERIITVAANNFVEASKLDEETLRIKAVVRDGNFYKFIIHNADKSLYHASSNTKIGRNIEECIQFYKNPANADLWAALEKEVGKYWGQ